MRALVISGPGRYALLDHELPGAGPGDLLLAPLAVGLCATDLELLRRGHVRPSVLVSHRYPLEAVEEAVATMRHRAPGTGNVLAQQPVRRTAGARRHHDGRDMTRSEL